MFKFKILAITLFILSITVVANHNRSTILYASSQPLNYADVVSNPPQRLNPSFVDLQIIHHIPIITPTKSSTIFADKLVKYTVVVKNPEAIVHTYTLTVGHSSNVEGIAICNGDTCGPEIIPNSQFFARQFSVIANDVITLTVKLKPEEPETVFEELNSYVEIRRNDGGDFKRNPLVGENSHRIKDWRIRSITSDEYIPNTDTRHTITYEDIGTRDNDNVVLKYYLPNEAELVDPGSYSYDEINRVITWLLPPNQTGLQQKIFFLKTDDRFNATLKDIESKVEIIEGTDTQSASPHIRPSNAKANLSLDVTPTNIPTGVAVGGGDTVQYTIELSNGDSNSSRKEERRDVKGVTLLVSLEPAFSEGVAKLSLASTDCPASSEDIKDNYIEFPSLNLAFNEVRECKVHVTIGPHLPDTANIITLTVQGAYQADPYPTTPSTDLGPVSLSHNIDTQPTFDTSFTATPQTAVETGEITYTVAVTNILVAKMGTNIGKNASNVQVAITLDRNTEFVEFLDCAGRDRSGDTIQWNIGSLGTGADAVACEFVVKVTDDVDPIIATATINSDQTTPATFQSDLVNLGDIPNLVIQNFSGNSTVGGISPVEYVAEIVNVGNATAEGIQLTFTVPDGAAYTGSSCSENDTSSQPIELTMPDIAAGANDTCTITVIPITPVAVNIDSLTATISVTESAGVNPNPENNTNKIFTVPLDVYGDLVVTMTLVTGTLEPGAKNWRYNVVVENIGPKNVEDVVLKVFFSDALTVEKNTTDGVLSGTTFVSHPFDLVAGEDEGFNFFATVRNDFDSHETKVVVESVTEITHNEDKNLLNNESIISRTITPLPDLIVSQTANRDSASAGDTIVYTVVVTNVGSMGVTIGTIKIKPSLYVNQLTTNNPNLLNSTTLQLLQLEAGAVQTYLVTTTLVEDIPFGVEVVTNTVEVSSPLQAEKVVDDENQSLSTIQLISDEQANLDLTMIASQDAVTPPTEVTYDIVITNVGNIDISGVTLYFTTTGEIENVSKILGRTNRAQRQDSISPINVGALEISQTKHYRVIISIPQSTDPTISYIASQAEVTFKGINSNYKKEYNHTITGTAILTLTVTPSQTQPLQSSDLLTYYVTIANIGTFQATNVGFEFKLDEQFEVISDGGLDYDPTGGANDLETTISPLFPNTPQTYTVVVTPQEGTSGTLTDTAYLIFDNRVVVTQTFTHEMARPLTMTIAKQANRIFVDEGEQIVYTIVVTNLSNVPANDVMVIDILPNELTFNEASDGGESGSLTPNRITWSNLEIAGDSQITLLLTATVNSEIVPPSTIVNENYEVSSDDIEPQQGMPVETFVGSIPITLTGMPIGAWQHKQEFTLEVDLNFTDQIDVAWSASGMSVSCGNVLTCEINWGTKIGTQLVTALVTMNGTQFEITHTIEIVEGDQITVYANQPKEWRPNTVSAEIEFPQGTVAQTTTFLLQPISLEDSDFQVANYKVASGYSFRMTAYDNHYQRQGSFNFEENTPINLTVKYDALFSGDDNLRLFYQRDITPRWVDLANDDSCDEAMYDRNTTNQLSIDVCHLTLFTLAERQMTHTQTVQVLQNGSIVTGAEVYIGGEYITTTNENGEIYYDPSVYRGTIVAMKAVKNIPAQKGMHEWQGQQDTAGIVYYTNVKIDGSVGTPVPQFETNDNTTQASISDENILVLFNLVVSLELGTDPAYVQTISDTINTASNILYDISDGQMAFGQVTIYNQSENWDDADIRIVESTLVLAQASVGAISQPNGAGWIHLGKLAYSEVDAPQTSNGHFWNEYYGPHTLVHEFAHYALYLEDSYKNKIGQPTVCTTEFPRDSEPANHEATMMADERTTELSDETYNWDPRCIEGTHYQEYGVSDWGKIKQDYPELKSPSDRGYVVSGPRRLEKGHLKFPHIIDRTTPLASRYKLTILDLACQPSSTINATLIKQGTDKIGTRLIELGAPNNGQLEITGAEEGDTVSIYSLTDDKSNQITLGDDENIVLGLLRNDDDNRQGLTRNPYIDITPSGQQQLQLEVRSFNPQTALPSFNSTIRSSIVPTDVASVNIRCGDDDNSCIESIFFNNDPVGFGQVIAIEDEEGTAQIVGTSFTIYQVTPEAKTSMVSHNGRLVVDIFEDTIEGNFSNLYGTITSIDSNALPLIVDKQLLDVPYIIRFSGGVGIEGTLIDRDNPARITMAIDPASSYENIALHRWNGSIWIPTNSVTENHGTYITSEIAQTGIYALMADKPLLRERGDDHACPYIWTGETDSSLDDGTNWNFFTSPTVEEDDDAEVIIAAKTPHTATLTADTELDSLKILSGAIFILSNGARLTLDRLEVPTGAKLILTDEARLTIEDNFGFGGTLQQTRLVEADSSQPKQFLFFRNGDNQELQRGVEIDSTTSTEVTVSLSDGYCEGLAEGVPLCFTIEPKQSMTASIKFYAPLAKLGGLQQDNLSVFYQTPQGVWQEINISPDITSDENYVSIKVSDVVITTMSRFIISTTKGTTVYLPVILRQPRPNPPTLTPVSTPLPTPTVTPTPTVIGQPNLQSSIQVAPAQPGSGEVATITIIVTNVGNAPVTNGFWVDLYIDPSSVPSTGGRWDNFSSSGIAWQVETTDFGGALEKGEYVTLVSVEKGSGPDGQFGFDPLQTNWGGLFNTGASRLYSYTDSFSENNSPNHLVIESNEIDNITGYGLTNTGSATATSQD